jgi:hypothetical protein
MLQQNNLDKEGREFFELLKEQSKQKELYIYLREQIKNQ